MSQDRVRECRIAFHEDGSVLHFDVVREVEITSPFQGSDTLIERKRYSPRVESLPPGLTNAIGTLLARAASWVQDTEPLK